MKQMPIVTIKLVIKQTEKKDLSKFQNIFCKRYLFQASIALFYLTSRYLI